MYSAIQAANKAKTAESESVEDGNSLSLSSPIACVPPPPKSLRPQFPTNPPLLCRKDTHEDPQVKGLKAMIAELQKELGEEKKKNAQLVAEVCPCPHTQIHGSYSHCCCASDIRQAGESINLSVSEQDFLAKSKEDIVKELLKTKKKLKRAKNRLEEADRERKKNSNDEDKKKTKRKSKVRAAREMQGSELRQLTTHTPHTHHGEQQPNSLDEELELSSREELIKKVKLLDAQNRAIAQTKSQVRRVH